MLCAVFSDSHGAETALERMLNEVWKQVGPIDYYLHLGDGVMNLEDLDWMIRDRDPKSVRCGVRGNCDRYSVPDSVPDTRVLRIGPAKVLMTHGHLFGVKSGLESLRMKAAQENCTCALFGHTHSPLLREANGILLLNPGAAMSGRMALLEIGEDGRASGRLLEL